MWNCLVLCGLRALRPKNKDFKEFHFVTGFIYSHVKAGTLPAGLMHGINQTKGSNLICQHPNINRVPTLTASSSLHFLESKGVGAGQGVHTQLCEIPFAFTEAFHVSRIPLNLPCPCRCGVIAW